MFMNTLLAGFFGGWEIVLILAVVLVLFGAKRLPELAKGLGQGIKEFKKASKDVTDEIQRSMDDENHPPSPPTKHIRFPSESPVAEPTESKKDSTDSGHQS